MAKKEAKKAAENKLISLMTPYRGLIIILILLAVSGNALTLWLPGLLAQAIDSWQDRQGLIKLLWRFAYVTVAVFGLSYWQNITQSYVAEKVARDLRKKLAKKLAESSWAQIQKIGIPKLMTNLTADVESVKNFVGQAVAGLVAAVFLLIAGSVLLIRTNWLLGLAVLVILPIIGVTFFVVFAKVKALFVKARELADWLNKVVNESIVGAAAVRVLHLQKTEQSKFEQVNNETRALGFQILKLFAVMMPVVTLAANLASLVILSLGSHLIIEQKMSLGEMAAFNSYLVILIFPIFVIGFLSNIIAQAQASYQRLGELWQMVDEEALGQVRSNLTGLIEVKDVSLVDGEKTILKKINLKVAAGSRVAIIGPTAAGKTQLLSILIGLVSPTEGSVKYDGQDLKAYERKNLYSQIGLVFQDSVIFNLSLRENIAFNNQVGREALERAIDTAELTDLIESLPEGLETIIAERGASLSGGQKQRLMLARALAIEPKILLLDDFTARVDMATEKKILANINREYPNITIVSVTQKIAAVENYDQLVVLMEGEIIAAGKHQELLASSPEYVQIYNSQQSTNHYEL